jgi:hypothetical protein
MSPHGPLPPYITFSSFILFFAGVWALALFITASTGGWRTLARKYAAPPNRSSEGETFRTATATIGKGWMPANYKSCMIVNLGRNGIYMKPWVIFSIFHPGLLIPWRAVKNIENEKYWLRNCAKIEIRDFDGVIRLYGKPGEEAVKAFAKFRL